MNSFIAVYNTGNTLQFAFANINSHPYYIGAEFPIGQSLVSALTLTADELDPLFDELIKSYIEFLDNSSQESFEKYEKSLFRVDEHCIYLHKIVDKLLEMINELHPRYKLSTLAHFVSGFTVEKITRLSSALSLINEAPDKPENKLSFWTTCSQMLINDFLEDIKILKDDVYEICNADDDYQGLSRLNTLDPRRKSFYLHLVFDARLSKSIGEAEKSKIFSTGPLGKDDIIHSVSTTETIETMYYELFTVLKNELPLKICKNCNKPFIPKGRVDSLYCDRIMPNFKDKCSSIGALNTYKNNLSDIETEFYATRRRYNTRVSRNPLLKTEFEVWKIKAREKLTAYRNDKISADEFRNWFMDDKWTKI